MSTDKKEEQVQQQVDGAGSSSAMVPPTEASPLAESTRRELIAALKQNWQREMEGVRTYRGLALKERDGARRKVLEKLADAETRHAQKWEQKLAELGAEPPQEERTLGMRFQ